MILKVFSNGDCPASIITNSPSPESWSREKKGQSYHGPLCPTAKLAYFSIAVSSGVRQSTRKCLMPSPE
ncbi:hypothetical protein QYF61_005023 [Mycteria americana]|uniref:Uncharacterized protein n=1 Tax=Mycteria americana TaxID=33587 RepID=A0AAN7NHM5_MYCAM|nr:hypothetical protein QYF61_005023 [Mycteria americana]